MTGSLLHNRIFRIVTAVLCVAAGCIFMFALENYGGISRDEFYQTICVRRYNESPLGLLVYWIGNLWSSIFGLTLKNLRILASLSEILAIAICSIYLFYSTRRLLLTSIVFLMSCIIIRAGGFTIYNWDTGAYFFDALALCCLLSTISKGSSIKYIMTGASIALVTLCRTPSGILLPLALVLIYFSCDNCKSKITALRPLAIILISFLVTILAFSLIILKNPLAYFSLFTDNNIITGHSPIKDHARLLTRLEIITRATPLRWFAGIGSLGLALLMTRLKKKKWLAVTITTLWIAYCAFMAYWLTPTNEHIELMLGMDTPVGLGLLLSLPVYCLFDNNCRPGFKLKLKLLGCFFMMCSVAFGSDGYYERLTCSFMLPVIIALLWTIKKKAFRTFVKCSIILLTASFFVLQTTHLIRFYSIYKDYPEVPYRFYEFRGLKISPADEDFVHDSFAGIRMLRSEGVPYVFLGENMLTELVCGPDEGLSFQQFHYIIGAYEHWSLFKDSIVDRIDAVVFNPKLKYYGYDQILSDLRQEGFTDTVSVEDAIIVYRKPRRNPLKKYPIYQSDGLTVK